MNELANNVKRLVAIAIIIYALVQMLCVIAIIALQLDALNNRKVSNRDRDVLKSQNYTIERQNKYKICLLEGIWRTVPEQRTESQLQKCKQDNL